MQHQEQQDAQEFLHFLLDHAHEELLALRKEALLASSGSNASQGAASSSAGSASTGAAAASAAGAAADGAAGGEEEWAQVGKGKKNRAAVTRQAGMAVAHVGAPAGAGDGAGSGAGSGAGGAGAAAAVPLVSPINTIFSGATRSVIKTSAAQPSATVEGFMMLHLDIDVPQVGALHDFL